MPMKQTPNIEMEIPPEEALTHHENVSSAIFSTSRIHLKLSNMKMEKLGPLYNTQFSEFVVVDERPDNESYISFAINDGLGFNETIAGIAVVHIYEGDVPLFEGVYTSSELGGINWHIVISLTTEQFVYLQQHITGLDNESDEKAEPGLSAGVVEIGGGHFSLAFPFVPGNLSFYAELDYLRIGDWKVV